MPIRKEEYPPNWPDIATAAKERAGWRCEWCAAPQKAVIRRRSTAIELGGYLVDFVLVPRLHVPAQLTINCYEPAQMLDTDTLSWPLLRKHGLTRIILTTAHLDRNTANNEPDNLAALCQRCHLRHDIFQHIANRRYGRDHAKAPQLHLPI